MAEDPSPQSALLPMLIVTPALSSFLLEISGEAGSTAGEDGEEDERRRGDMVGRVVHGLPVGGGEAPRTL